MFSKITRPVLFTLGLLVIGAGAASAADYYYAADPCNPCKPVKVVRVVDPCDPCAGGTRRGFRWFGWFRR